MLKSIYETLDAIPEGERQHYALTDGKYVLQIEDQHPLVIKNKELLREKSTDKAAITRLTNEKATLEATALPPGHVPVPAADAQELSAYKAIGKPDDLKTAVTERDTLKTEFATVKREQSLRDVAEIEGWKFTVLKQLAGDLEFEITENTDDKGEKTRGVNVVVTKDDKKESKAANVYADENWKDFLPSLKAAEPEQKPQGTQYVHQAVNKQNSNPDPAKAYLNRAYSQPA